MRSFELQTERLWLRHWKPSDLPPFAEMNADPRVMQFYPATLTEAESNSFAERIEEGLSTLGFGLWAVEVPGVAPFIGYVGLFSPNFEAHFTPCVEIGWRLAFEHWGKGYASEAARQVLGHGTEELALSEIVSFTAAINHRSRAVMERIGMKRDPDDDFEHPKLMRDNPLCRHVLYRFTRSEHTLAVRP